MDPVPFPRSCHYNDIMSTSNMHMPFPHQSVQAQILVDPNQHQALCIILNPWVNSNLSYSPETLNSDQNRQIIGPVWPSNLMEDIEKQWGTSMLLQTLCIIS